MNESHFPAPPAAAAPALRRMFVRDMVLEAHIGVHAHEFGRTQRVRINLDLAVREEHDGPAAQMSRDVAGAQMSRGGVGRDDLARVVDYERIVLGARAAVAAGHVQLVETLAERLAELCLADARVVLVRVRVEKLDVFADMDSVGVEIERRNS
ncbi:dihydroneopterin aldolase [Acidiphilium sp. C61]|jgi:dihydroneopterin aldolase|uniref:dihydroneopterin aldolase n=1 Tax=Acidiphilium sp. C61 TaxID=1671485 RepID=UPI00157A73AD|nr:dihydroneopterin aldolase [Acidiphilium sp. C61]